MGMLDSLSGIFGGGDNAPEAMMQYLQQIAPMLKSYMQPWIDRGNVAYGKYSSALDGLLNNPSGFINNIQSQYQASPGYQYQLGETEKASNNAAAAGGTLGTGANQSDIMGRASGLADQYQQQYMQNVLGQFDQGLQGEQGLTDLGESASQGLSTSLAENMKDMGTAAYQTAEDQDNGLSGILSSVMGFMGNHMPANASNWTFPSSWFSWLGGSGGAPGASGSGGDGGSGAANYLPLLASIFGA